MGTLLNSLSGNSSSIRIVTIDADGNSGMTKVPNLMAVQWASQPGRHVYDGIYSSILSTSLLYVNGLRQVLHFTQSKTISHSNEIKNQALGDMIPMLVDRVGDRVWENMTDCGSPRNVGEPTHSR